MKNIFQLNGKHVPLQLFIRKVPKTNQNIIAVIATVRRIYYRILINLIERDIIDKQPEEQAEFRARISTRENHSILEVP